MATASATQRLLTTLQPAGGAQGRRPRHTKRRLIESVHGLPSFTSVSTCGAGRPGQDTRCCRLGLVDRAIPQPRISRKRRVDDQAEAFDPRLARLQQQRRDGTNPLVSVQWTSDTLQEVRPTLDVVVQQHDHLPASDVGASVARSGEAEVRAELDDLHAWELLPYPLRRTVFRPVVADDHVVRHRLRAQAEKTTLGEVPVVHYRNDNVQPDARARAEDFSLRGGTTARHAPYRARRRVSRSLTRCRVERRCGGSMGSAGWRSTDALARRSTGPSLTTRNSTPIVVSSSVKLTSW